MVSDPIIKNSSLPAAAASQQQLNTDLSDSILAASLPHVPYADIERFEHLPESTLEFGNKALRLKALIGLGLPVPPGIGISSDRIFKSDDPLDQAIGGQLEVLRQEAKILFKRNHISFAVRSSPRNSMPGLLRTVLNCETVQDVVSAVSVVKDSWFSPEACSYRQKMGIDDSVGMGIIVQCMARGNLNLDSASGVAFSRDPLEGHKGMIGRYVYNDSGDAVVNRTERIPHKIGMTFLAKFPVAFDALARATALTERHFCNVQEMEFVIENSALWLVQSRDAVQTSDARIRFTLSTLGQPGVDPDAAIQKLKDEGQVFVNKLGNTQDYTRFYGHLISGSSYSCPGAAEGPLAFSMESAQRLIAQGQRPILLAVQRHEEIPMAILDGNIAGILADFGHEALHESVLAVSQGVPMINGPLHDASGMPLVIEGDTLCVNGWENIKEGTLVVIDAQERLVWIREIDPQIVPVAKAEITRLPFVYTDEKQRIRESLEGESYESLLKLHSRLTYEIQGANKITVETIRKNIQAHEAHLLINEKGKNLGKTPLEVGVETEFYLQKAVFNRYGGINALPDLADKALAEAVGITEISVGTSLIGFYFLDGKWVSGRYPEDFLAEAVQKRDAFMGALGNSKVFQAEKMTSMGLRVFDPMMHGHGTGYLVHLLGVSVPVSGQGTLEDLKLLDAFMRELRQGLR